MRTAGSALVVLSLAALVPRVARAQTVGAVYDPLPPPGSAYVRFVNATGGVVQVAPDFAPAQRLGTLDGARITPYGLAESVAGRVLGVKVSAQGEHSVVALHAAPGEFLTVLVELAPGGGLAVVPVTDQTEFNQARARLAFYNAAPGCAAATLVLAHGASVFQNVASGSAKARSVNPVAAPVQAVCDGKEVAALTLAGMEAGGMYSVWLMHPPSGALAFLARDATVRLRR